MNSIIESSDEAMNQAYDAADEASDETWSSTSYDVLPDEITIQIEDLDEVKLYQDKRYLQNVSDKNMQSSLESNQDQSSGDDISWDEVTIEIENLNEIILCENQQYLRKDEKMQSSIESDEGLTSTDSNNLGNLEFQYSINAQEIARNNASTPPYPQEYRGYSPIDPYFLEYTFDLTLNWFERNVDNTIKFGQTNSEINKLSVLLFNTNKGTVNLNRLYILIRKFPQLIILKHNMEILSYLLIGCKKIHT